MERKQIVEHLNNAINIVKKLDDMPTGEITRQDLRNAFNELSEEIKACEKLDMFIFQPNDDGDDMRLTFILTQKLILDGPLSRHLRTLKSFLARVNFELRCALLWTHSLK